MINKFPLTIPLSGADYFMLLLDKHMRKSIPTGNIGRFAVKVDGIIDSNTLQKQLSNDKLLLWLGSVRYKKSFPFSTPHWTKQKDEAIQIFEHVIDENHKIPALVFERDISVKKPPLFCLDLVKDKDATWIILSWHHALMDAHGAEMLMKILSQTVLELEEANIFPSINQEKKFIELLNKSKEAKDYLVSATPKLVTSVLKEKSKSGPSLEYYTIHFTEEETQIIDSRSKELGLRFGISPLYLAATCRSIYYILNKRNRFFGDFWIPIPQDQRLRGAFGPIVSNQVSFLFYKVTSEDLGSLKMAIQSISNQMVQLIRDGISKTYGDMMTLFRKLPLSFYSTLVKGPTKGAIASFFFSDTGDSLKDFNTFMNHPIQDVIHYPPNIYPPGFTIIFMRYKGRLKAVLGFTDSNFEHQEIKEIESLLRSDLLG